MRGGVLFRMPFEWWDLGRVEEKLRIAISFCSVLGTGVGRADGIDES